MNAIKLENIGKKFILTSQKERTAKGFFSSLPGQKIASEYWALRNINMEIEKGKAIGIIGRNGAGKTTLLNILAGITAPTLGRVKIDGRISSLLTLGAGFQDELSGKENIYLNSSILGMSRNEINKKYRSIVEFSELDGFLDSPLQTYSQGMRLRLGFSLAVHLDFDILIIDEILSVGDVSFQKKCFDRIEEFRKQGKTMIIVTQALDIVERLCEEAHLLENGEIVEKGEPQRVIARYLALLEEKKLPETFQRRYSNIKWWADKRFWGKSEGSKEVRITEVKIYNSRGRRTGKFRTGDPLTAEVYFTVNKEVQEPHFGLAIFREDGVYCYGPNTYLDGYPIDKLNKGKGHFALKYKSLSLMPGRYRFSAAIWDKNEVWAYDYHVGFYKFEIFGENNDGQLLNLKHRWQPEYWRQRFKFLPLKEPGIYLNLKDQAQDRNSSSDIEFSSIELFDSSDNPKNTFSTGEGLRVKLRFAFNKKPQEHYLWVGLFRNDDVYCHGSSNKLMEKIVSLTYPVLPLLAGDYYISLGIWGKNQREALLYKHKAAVFKVSFSGEDHGTVYLEHSWKWQLP